MKSIVFALSTLLALPAVATQCAMKSPEKIAESARIAFIGKVVSIRESRHKPHDFCSVRSDDAPSCGGKLVTIQVTERLLGRVPSTTEVVSEDACYCLGSYWNVGSTYLVVASRNYKDLPGDVIAEDVCSGTGELNEEKRALVRALRSAKR